MVVDDDGAKGLLEDPHATVGDKLPETIRNQEAIEACLPDLACVGAAGHVALNDEHVTMTPRVVRRKVAELGQPWRDHSV